jgi:hypothetical protein
MKMSEPLLSNIVVFDKVYEPCCICRVSLSCLFRTIVCSCKIHQYFLVSRVVRDPDPMLGMILL